MTQRKLWSTVLCLLISGCFSLASAEPQAPQFQTVSPFMAAEPLPAENTNPNLSPMLPTSPALTPTDSPVKDPYESMNRKIFNFNDSLDTHFLVPVSKTYNKVMPKPLNRGISNFFSNLNNLPTIGNDMLQGNFYQATSDSWRFFVNSTAGAAGLFDVANNMGLEPNTEDFGLTLARWGYTDTSYVVLPFFGPSTVRDTAGLPVDFLFFSVYGYIQDPRTSYTLYALNIVSNRARLLQYQNLYDQIALDRYAFIRNAYLQQRANAIDRNQHLSDPYFNLTSKKNAGVGSSGTGS
jgi:phospholipid-binding lipoprotein MlaA